MPDAARVHGCVCDPWQADLLPGSGRLLLVLVVAEAPLVLGLGNVAVRECRQSAVGGRLIPPAA
ncbi:hypothetical protein OHO28_02630 [Streptomyces europaeiscabiei]|uniref:hypothetical protein n=1 Tax=Streptomyces europaeiscabiei TaxID=146819 RepID=UPI002E171363